MPRRESGLRPIGDSIRKIIERIRKEREERGRKNKPIRTQPKLPGMKAGGFKSKQERKETEKKLRSAKGRAGLRSFLSDSPKINEPMKKDRYMEGRKARLKQTKRKIGKRIVGAISRLSPAVGVAKGLKNLVTGKSKKRDFQKGDYGDISVKKGGGMLRYKKGGFPDLSGDGKTTMKDVLIGRGVIKKKKGGNIDKSVRVIDLQKQGKTSKKGIRVKGKGKSFMDVYKKTVYNRADGGMVPFGGEKRVPGSGAATRGTGFKGIF